MKNSFELFRLARITSNISNFLLVILFEPWPPISKVISKSRQGSARERIKYYLRLLMAANRKAKLIKVILQSEALDEFFKIHTKNLHSPLSYFLDRRWGMNRRFDAFIYDLQTASQLWGEFVWK